jgi:glycosyltransferase involved in cell wall biosynthesis
VEVLSNDELRQSLMSWGGERAKLFTWEMSARRALRAFERLHEERKRANPVNISVRAAGKPLLAFVSPLPAEHSDTATYSARLLPDLARYYEITCIADQAAVTDPWITAEFPIREVGWFKANAGKFDRILYQLGNSASYQHIFALLERYAGVVVLHDFNLGAVLNQIGNSGSGSFTKTLYDSHGFPALQADQKSGREDSISRYPCNAAVLRAGVGLIVHSADLVEQARHWYGERASDFVRYIPIPVTAAMYHDTVEELYGLSPRAREEQLVLSLARIVAPAAPAKADLAAVAAALAANRERFGLPQILVDVTTLAKYDASTGIQRVTRAILMALIADPPTGYRIEPVRALDSGYLYARRFTCQCLDLPEDGLKDDPVETAPGDIFLGMDWGADVVPQRESWFLAQKRRGIQILFCVYDLLPLIRPEFFPPGMSALALAWASTVATVADGIVCISRTVADELHEWLCQKKPSRLQPLSLGFFHLGADLHASLPSKSPSQVAAALFDRIRSHPSFLMVGTVEPRKGHRQALAAMEQLWADGVNVNLVIVGNKGWMTDDLEERILRHPEHESRLFWLRGASDEVLEEVYRSARALLAASEGEGFGLPLIEAAHYALPIIARDIPIFREVAGEQAYYFRGDDPRALADALRAWLALRDAAPSSSGISRLNWQQSSRQLLDVVLGKRWHVAWPATTCQPGSDESHSEGQ